MSRLIESLERRTLLTATATSLSAELTAVNTDSAAVKADLTALQTGVKADYVAIKTDLKGTAKTNAPLLATLQKDETKFLAKVKADVTALLKVTVKAAKGAADGNAVIAAPTNGALTAKITTDVTALAAASTPLGKLTTDSSTATLAADLTALTNAKSLSTDLTKAQADLNTLTGKLLSDAGKFNTAVGALKTDLTTLLPVPTTTPSLVGDYKGTVKTKGVIFGLGAQTFDMEIIVTSQTINSVTGSITVDNNTASGTITATELSNGKLTLKINQSGFTISLTGKVNVTTTGTGLPPGSVISGSGSLTISGFKVDGSFTLTKIT